MLRNRSRTSHSVCMLREMMLHFKYAWAAYILYMLFRASVFLLIYNIHCVLQVGRFEVNLISPDSKTVVLEKNFKDISSCCQVGLFLLLFTH